MRYDRCPICHAYTTECGFDGNTCEFDWDSRPGFWGDTHTWNETTKEWEESK